MEIMYHKQLPQLNNLITSPDLANNLINNSENDGIIMSGSIINGPLSKKEKS